MARLHRLPARGRLLVSPDIHGNEEDFLRLRALFTELLTDDPDAQWVQLGDVVHGPDPRARARWPDLYDFDDASDALVQGFVHLQDHVPGQVHVLLGNHEWAHLGGVPTRKFWADEAAHLEGSMSARGHEALDLLLARAPLLVATPCGALLAHACPDAVFERPEDLEAVALPATRAEHHALLSGLLRPRCQPPETTDRLLAACSEGSAPLRFVVHGHEIDPKGWYIEERNQLGMAIFGTTRAQKRYLLLDLSARYESVYDLAPGREILQLYPEA